MEGPVNKLLQGERIALNLLSRASGIATMYFSYLARILLIFCSCQEFNEIKKQQSWNGVIAGTRKTTPGNFTLG